MSEEERTIKRVYCHSCSCKMILQYDRKDKDNSDFYVSDWECPECENAIEIITHEIRD